MSKKYDIVLMGATSFVGQITYRRLAEYINNHAPELSIAVAGRSLAKLTSVQAEVSKRLNLKLDTPMIVADSMTEADMQGLAQSANVVISTVGPFDQYGERLVKACAENGTHYCDLTGEPNFIADMLAKYETVAQNSGACIVHCCGFDSLPSDLGAYYLQQQSIEKFGEPCLEIDMRVNRMQGTLSGGTMASMINIVKKAKVDKDLRKTLMNPYAIAPSLTKVKQKFLTKVVEDDVTKGWLAPFMMASINTKVVLRSAMQLPSLFPENFMYSEAMHMGEGSKAKKRAKNMARGLGFVAIGSAVAPIRWVLEKFVLPKPGTGPSEQAQVDGYFTIVHYGKTSSGKRIAVEVHGDQDPGYGSTAKMLTQAATVLATEIAADQPGGFWTPAKLLGDKLVPRLSEYAGVTIKTIE
ncbi:saccharopine dehydrogenase family protein [Reinekea sp.]|jgi:short subunit dehydrogenase-like uncharacterized protein|uniref:saccharopine dehydrogenase family protein n=2 Tax=Reinekea sp. TaxID=1970455 RepID=UPI0039897A34